MIACISLFILLAAGSAQVCHAHTSFTNFYVDGVNQGDGVAVRMNGNPAKATFPVEGIANSEMACGMFIATSIESSCDKTDLE